MLWVYGHYKYLFLSVRASTLDVYGRQILASTGDLRAERVNLLVKIYGNKNTIKTFVFIESS